MVRGNFWKGNINRGKRRRFGEIGLFLVMDKIGLFVFWVLVVEVGFYRKRYFEICIYLSWLIRFGKVVNNF